MKQNSSLPSQPPPFDFGVACETLFWDHWLGNVIYRKKGRSQLFSEKCSGTFVALVINPWLFFRTFEDPRAYKNSSSTINETINIPMVAFAGRVNLVLFVDICYIILLHIWIKTKYLTKKTPLNSWLSS